MYVQIRTVQNSDRSSRILEHLMWTPVRKLPVRKSMICWQSTVRSFVPKKAETMDKPAGPMKKMAMVKVVAVRTVKMA